VDTLDDNGANAAQIVVIDGKPSAIADANLHGLAAIEGDATRREILRRAEIIKAREVVITLDRDDSSILVTLTVRQLNPSAHVVVAFREDDNASLVRQSGANAVVTSSASIGRLLGLSAFSPNLGIVIEDLLSSRRAWRWGAPGDPEGRQIAGRGGRRAGDRRGRNKTLRRFRPRLSRRSRSAISLVLVRQAVPDA
jgi:voltage-gated potassium channel